MNGTFGYYNLMEWWRDSFTDEEKDQLEFYYNDEESFNELFHGNILSSSESVVGFLQGMGNNLARSKKYDLSLKFLNQGEFLKVLGTAADVHFLYLGFLEYYSEYSLYHNHDKLVEYARKQIEISALAAKEIIDEHTRYRIAHRGYEIYSMHLKTINAIEEVKSIIEKAKEEKWNYNYWADDILEEL